MTAVAQALAGLKVLEFGGYAAGPHIGKVLGNFGAEDHGITPADVAAFEKTMRGMNRRIDAKVYDGAGHGFENSTNAAAYKPDAAADAWARTIAFLNRALH